MACLISFPTGLVVLRVYDEDIRAMKKSSGNAFLKFRQARVKMKGTVDPVHIELTVCGPDEGVMPIFNTITGCVSRSRSIRPRSRLVGVRTFTSAVSRSGSLRTR